VELRSPTRHLGECITKRILALVGGSKLSRENVVATDAEF